MLNFNKVNEGGESYEIFCLSDGWIIQDSQDYSCTSFLRHSLGCLPSH